MKKFNHMFDVAFSVETEIEDPDKVPNLLLCQALTVRLANLMAEVASDPQSCSSEAYGHCDTYEITDKARPLTNDLKLYDADLNCQHTIVSAPGGGIKCSKCSGWFCY